MGRDKATLPFGPETMLARVYRILSEVVEPIAIVAAADAAPPAIPGDARIVHDRDADRGPLEGIAAGLHALPGDVRAAYVTSCDVPLLRAALVRRMIQLLGEHDIAVPCEPQFVHPLAAVYRRQLAPRIDGLLAAGHRRPLALIESVDSLRVDVDQLREVDPELYSLQNLNRPADYRRALAAAGLPAPDWLDALP